MTRVVGRDFVFGPPEKEKFRAFMRMYENFSGCRVLAYCLMCNHIHILLEVPPMPAGGLTDAELLKRLRAIYSEAEVAVVERRLAEVRLAIAEGRADESLAAEIHERFTYRMHDLGEYLKTLLGRFTRWFNGSHERTGTLWEGRFKSVLVEAGVAARAMAAYIVDEIFNACRERFGARRKDGARAPRGRASPAKGVLWSARDLKVRL